MLCAVCHREARGFYYQAIGTIGDIPACSMECLWQLGEKGKEMIDKTGNEKEAIAAAGKAGGEFLDEIGQYDIAGFNKSEFNQFIECVVSRYVEYLADIRIPKPGGSPDKSSEDLPF